MNKKLFMKGFLAAILSIAFATIFGSSASYAEAVITRGLFTDSNDVRWEWEKTIDADNETEPESVSIMFYDKPVAATTIVVPSLNDVITAAGATETLNTYYVRSADEEAQATNFPSETKRTSTADVTKLDMTNTSKVQILGVKPILNPETEAELVFGENMVIGDNLAIHKRISGNICTSIIISPYSWIHGYYCKNTQFTTIENAETLIEGWDQLSVQDKINFDLTPESIGYALRKDDGIPEDEYDPSKTYFSYSYQSETTIESEGAFEGNKLKLTNLENVKYIGWYAFEGTTLNQESRHITIKANQTAGEGVFAGSNATSVTFEGTETFPAMFRDCQDLTEVNFGNVETVSYETFRNTNLGSVDFSNTNVKTILAFAFKNTNLTSINLEGVQSIGGEAFADNDLTSIVLPKSIIDLNEARIFAGNKNLTELTIAYDTMMMDYPLHNVIGEWVSEPDAVVHNIKKLTLIAPYAEDEVVGANHHTYEEILRSGRTSNGYMWSFEEDLDSDVESYKNVIAPSYFAWFTSLEEITIGEGYEFVGVNAFYNYLYKAFQISPAQYYYEYLADDADWAGFNQRKYHVSLPESLKGIGANSFALHPELDFSINLPEALEYIGPHAFENDAYMMNDIDLPNLKHLGFQAFFVTGVHNVYLHDKLEYVGGTPFMSCWNLNDVTFDYDVFGINNGAILGAGTWGAAMLGHVIVTYDIGSSYSSAIAKSHYADKMVRASVNWDQHILKRGNITFTEKAVTEPNTTPNWLYMTATKTVDLSKTPWKTISPHAFGGASIEKLLLPEHIETIGDNAFDSTRIQSELVLPDSVKSIGANAFNNWANSTSTGAQYEDGKYVYYYIDEQDNLYRDGEFVQVSTGGITASHSLGVTITKLPSSLESVGYAAFFGDRNLTADVNMPNLKTVTASAFMDTHIKNVTLGSAIELVGQSAFQGIPTLEKVTIDCDYLSVAQGYANMLNNFNARLSFVNELSNIVDGMMAKEVIFTERATTAPTIAGFLYGAKAETVDLSNVAWTELPRNSFINSKIQTLKLPRSTTNIQDDTFYNMQAPDGAEEPFTTVYVPSTITTLGREAFEFAKVQFEGLVNNQAFSEGLTTIGDAAFYGTEVYGDLVIPESVTSVGFSAFNAGDADTQYDTVTIKAPLDYTKTSNQAIFQLFWNAKMDKLVIESPMLPVLGTLQDEPVLPADIEVDGVMVSPLRADGEPEFHGMTMREVVITGLSEITANAFEECGNLEKVVFSSDAALNRIDKFAFSNANKLKRVEFGEANNEHDINIEEYAFNNTAIETLGTTDASDFNLAAANFHTVNEHVFSNMPKLKTVDIPNNFNIDESLANEEKFINGAHITAFTFSDDPELEGVTIGYQIAEIRDGAFLNDEKLAKMFIWGNAEIQESDQLIRDFNNTTIPKGTTIFGYSDAPSEVYANNASRDNYDGKFYALDEVLYLTSNRTYVVLEQDEEGNNVDFKKDGLKLYALRRDGVILESDNWQQYTTAYPRSTVNISFNQGRGMIGSDFADIAAVVYDAPKPFETISLANQNYANVNYAFLQMPSSNNPLVLINYPDGYTGNIRTTTLASMTEEEEEEYLEELEVPNTGTFLNVVKTATPVVSIAAIVLAGTLYITKKRKM